MIFVELPTFQKALFRLYKDHLLDPEAYRRLQNALFEGTTRIDTIPGTGGVRKARWKTKGGGKSGGVRAIYYHHEATGLYLMLTIYKKGRQDKLTLDQRKELKVLVDHHLGEVLKQWR